MKNSSPIPHTFCAPTLNKQKGAALILLVFALILVVLAYTVRALNSNDLQARENAKTFQALAEAKAALISWSVSHPNTPGQMPWPDRNGDHNYDGNSDCATTAFQYSYLLGQLPIVGQTNPCVNPQTGLGGDWRDAQGNRLWYAVSRNLVHDYEHSQDPIINPGMMDTDILKPNPYDGTSATSAYPWMTVYDKNGQLISDKVAAVIIAPGAPLNDQDRSSGIAGAPDYLDSFNLQAGGGAKSNRTYSGPDEDFYIGEDSRGVRSDNTTYQQPYYFNDKLVYITIDELMAEIEKRAAGEARLALQSYYTNSSATPSARFFPYAAALGSTTNSNQCVVGNLQGLLPINSASSYTCTYSSTSPTAPVNNSVTCSFAAASSISFTRTSGTYGANSGACVRQNSNATCNCTGAGSCSTAGGTVRFSCDACGVCTTVATGTSSVGKGWFSFTTTGIFSSTGTSSLTLTNNSSGSFSLNACSDSAIPAYPTAGGLPQWFAKNGWKNYIYYAVSNKCTSGDNASCTSATPQLTVGSRTGVRSLLVSTGKPIISSPFAQSKVPASAQTRTSSCDVKDYLDSTQNTNATLVNGSADLVYDATNTARSSSYNDQMFIVAP